MIGKKGHTRNFLAPNGLDYHSSSVTPEIRPENFWHTELKGTDACIFSSFSLSIYIKNYNHNTQWHSLYKFYFKICSKHPPNIYIYMQKEDSLSFPTVLGSGGCRLSLLNKICVGAKWLRLWFLWSFNVIWKLHSMWFEINIHNNSYVFFYDTKNYLMLWQAVISWSFYCDEMWFTEVYRNLP